VRNRISQVAFDLDDIDQRLQQLLAVHSWTSYSKQKESLTAELESFSSTLPNYVTLEIVTPRDLCKFLIFKDRYDRTQVHQQGCPYIGQKGQHRCGCPLRLSCKTVHSYVGKLRSIFRPLGRQGEWDKRLGKRLLESSYC
jgi:hypothetical protein